MSYKSQEIQTRPPLEVLKLVEETSNWHRKGKKGQKEKIRETRSKIEKLPKEYFLKNLKVPSQGRNPFGALLEAAQRGKLPLGVQEWDIKHTPSSFFGAEGKTGYIKNLQKRGKLTEEEADSLSRAALEEKKRFYGKGTEKFQNHLEELQGKLLSLETTLKMLGNDTSIEVIETCLKFDKTYFPGKDRANKVNPEKIIEENPFLTNEKIKEYRTLKEGIKRTEESIAKFLPASRFYKSGGENSFTSFVTTLEKVAKNKELPPSEKASMIEQLIRKLPEGLVKFKGEPPIRLKELPEFVDLAKVKPDEPEKILTGIGGGFYRALFLLKAELLRSEEEHDLSLRAEALTSLNVNREYLLGIEKEVKDLNIKQIEQYLKTPGVVSEPGSEGWEKFSKFVRSLRELPGMRDSSQTNPSPELPEKIREIHNLFYLKLVKFLEKKQALIKKEQTTRAGDGRKIQKAINELSTMDLERGKFKTPPPLNKETLKRIEQLVSFYKGDLYHDLWLSQLPKIERNKN